MYQNIEDLTESPIVGQYYMVPCVINNKNAFEVPSDIISTCTPIYPDNHSDLENGQHYMHLHADSRFICKYGDIEESAIIDNLKYIIVNYARFNSKINELEIKYLLCKCMYSHEYQETPVRFISKSKLNSSCISSGKCVHRGHDLSNITPINGVITCPLHGLKFDSITKELIQ